MGMNKDAVQNERQPRNTATIRPESLINDRESERLLREGVAATVAAVFKEGSGGHPTENTSNPAIVRVDDERDGQVSQRLAATVAAVIGNATTGPFMSGTNSTGNSQLTTRPQESEKLLRDVAAVFNSATAGGIRHHLPPSPCHPMQFLRNQSIDDTALCFCPFHRGFHNAWTVYGLAPDGSVQLNPGRDFSK